MIAADFARRAARRALPALSLLLASACATVGEPPRPDASMGLVIARDRCAACHQIGGSGESPNPRAPAFGTIVERPGMTEGYLAAFLADGHDYPVEMGFRLESYQAASLAACMVRWRSGATPQP